jgi:hypothetical protein
VANILSGSTYYVDVASTGAASCLESADIQIVGIFYHSDTANQHAIINDIAGTAAAGTPTVGALKLKIGNSIAHETLFYDLASCPIRCSKGIWVSILDSGSLTLIVKAKG